MKNIHVLPTLQASEYFINKEGILSESYSLKRGGAVHFYITSDEEITRNDYWLNVDNNTISNGEMFELANDAPSCKKIILTTDQDLIKDGVEVINDDFLEWFVKNPSCEEVVIDFDYNSYKLGKSKSKCYKIIIPKEEPTLKELYLKNNPERNIVIEERVNNFMKQL